MLFKITNNGFIKISTNGKTFNTYFYHSGDEALLIREGFVRVP